MTTQGSAVAEFRNLRHYTRVNGITRNADWWGVLLQYRTLFHMERKRLEAQTIPTPTTDYNTSTKGLLPPGDGNSSEAA